MIFTNSNAYQLEVPLQKAPVQNYQNQLQYRGLAETSCRCRSGGHTSCCHHPSRPDASSFRQNST